jgi:hypothetical protein
VGDSELLVQRKLREMGMTPVEVKKANAGMKMEINLRPGRVKLKDLAVFCRQFATMVNSGLPILRALAILSEQTQNKELAKILVEVRTAVEQGSSLSGALEKHPKAFNDLFVAWSDRGNRRGPRRRAAELADMIERRSSSAAGSVGHLPDHRPRHGRRHHGDHAAVRVHSSGRSTRPGQLPLPTRGSCSRPRTPWTYWWMVPPDDRRRLVVPQVQRHRTAPASTS